MSWIIACIALIILGAFSLSIPYALNWFLENVVDKNNEEEE